MTRRPASLSTQLVLVLGGLALLTLVGVGLFLGRIATDELGRAQQAALQATARSAAELLATELRDREREIELLSLSPLLTRGVLDAPLVRETLQRRQVLHDELAWLGIASPDGRVLQSTGGLLVGASVAEREWFIGARDRVYVGDVHEAKLLARLLPGNPNGEPTRFVDFAAPIHDEQGQLRGVVGAHAHWRWITGIVEGSKKRHGGDASVDALIVDREGRVLYPEGLKLSTDGVAVLPKGRLDASARWFDGKDYLTAEAEVQARTHTDLGWRIIVRQPMSEAMRPVISLRNHLLLLGAGAALLALLLAWWLARRLSRPVEQLARFAQRVETAREMPELKAGTVRELSQLGEAISSMARSLLEAERGLQAANSSLEAQVQARTAELREANLALEKLASHDPLTGLANRRILDDRLAEALALDRRYAAKSGRRHALLLIDADHFKQVNDVHGHTAGDAVLRQLAGLLRQSVRASDTVARFGGEEFAVLLPECIDADEAMAAAEKIRAAVALAAFPEVGQLTVSLGVSLTRADDVSPKDLVMRADAALYQAKHGGRNRAALREA
ncbi:MAG: GGDEF domain-containing protein [Roseateles depolymerans]|uniref:diguanylate cyclase n=1 Tax=Roseateles depolymerans TaxID=76731 RepID=A0A2W5DIX1_9BURK|nr:MAG: GGDEF domain-containing protein [Roseateles depolymerans]